MHRPRPVLPSVAPDRAPQLHGAGGHRGAVAPPNTHGMGRAPLVREPGHRRRGATGIARHSRSVLATGPAYDRVRLAARCRAAVLDLRVSRSGASGSALSAKGLAGIGAYYIERRVAGPLARSFRVGHAISYDDVDIGRTQPT